MLNSLLKELTELLVDELPIDVESLCVKQTVCCARLYYYDRHAPCGYILFKLIFESEREELFESEEYPFDEFWHAWNNFGTGPEIQIGGESKPKYRTEQLLSEIHPQLAPDSNMLKYRAALGRACKQLNKKDWGQFTNVTDDFVIALADGSSCFDELWDDITSSVPKNKIKMLLENELIDDYSYE